MKHGLGLEQDPRHDPHLPDAGRGQQVRGRRVEARTRAAARAGVARALSRLEAADDGRRPHRDGLPAAVLLARASACRLRLSTTAVAGTTLLQAPCASSCAADRPRRCDYAGLAARPRRSWQATWRATSAVARAEFDRWPAPEQLAFLINAYNAWTVELILLRWTRRSLRSRDLGSPAAVAVEKALRAAAG
ncbi:MAG: DUF547 domain-containing protein [Rhodopseudomonas palustris]|nr:DUF547 domain-containing protein [Rhodopseudomonas palustris]